MVITRRKSIGVPATRSDGKIAPHSWPDPPTDVCGQPGSKVSGAWFNRPSSLKKKVRSPDAN